MADTETNPLEALGIERAQMPRHIAIIMDGNGRWAKRRDLPRVRGHEQGAQTVRTMITECARLGLEVLTLYSFSNENWKRPQAEVDFLMDLYCHYLVAERGEIMDNNVRLIHVGRREGLPSDVLREMDTTIAASRENTGLKLCLALNYGGRTELVDAVRSIAAQVRDGEMAVEDVSEDTVRAALYAGDLPDPDLLIRTAGERRVSNFLLWQISYTEWQVCEACWPDFTVEMLHDAIRDYARRERRFGGLTV